MQILFEDTWGGGLGAGGEEDDRGWDGWMASLTRWMWVWVKSGSWWWTGRPGVLQFMGSQRVGHDWVTELNSTELILNWNLCLLESPTSRVLPWTPVELWRREWCVHTKSLQSCPTLCDPMDCSPPGSSVHGTLVHGQEYWYALPFPSWPRDWTCVSLVSCTGRQVRYH